MTEYVIGTSGADRLGGKANKNNVILGYQGDDTLTGAGLADTVFGADGRDVISGSGGGDVLHGMDGGDRIDGGAGDDEINGGRGSDTINGGHGSDKVSLDDAFDRSSRLHVETVSLGTGNDFVFAGRSQDRIDGGTGQDAVYYSNFGSLGVTVDLERGVGSGGDAQGDTYVSVEHVIGSYQGDRLTGDAAGNFFIGLSGNDTLNGGGGADSLDGGDGSDVLEGGGGGDSLAGGAGADVFVYRAATDSTASGRGCDAIVGFDEDDRIDLRSIDADPTTAGNQAFTFVNWGPFTGEGAELRVVPSNAAVSGAYVVQADTDGDRVVDFAIRVTTAMPTFGPGDIDY